MLEPKFHILALAALIPIAAGFIWYNPKTLGNAWMKASGVTAEQAGKGNKFVVFGLTFVFSFMLAMGVMVMCIHQFHVFSIFVGLPDFMTPGSEVNNELTSFMSKYGDRYRTFKHGALHGLIGGFEFALPIIGVNALFERKGFKYIAINAAFWILCMTLMGGLLCATI